MLKGSPAKMAVIVKIRLFETLQVLFRRHGGELFEVFDKMGLVIKGRKISRVILLPVFHGGEYVPGADDGGEFLGRCADGAAEPALEGALTKAGEASEAVDA